MNTYEKRFPELYQLLSGLFHQYWKEVFDWNGREADYKEVIKYFKSISKSNHVERWIDELKSFLALDLSEDEIYEIIRHEWNVAFRPAGFDLTYHQWLKNILEVLEEPIEKTKREFIPEFIG